MGGVPEDQGQKVTWEVVFTVWLILWAAASIATTLYTPIYVKKIIREARNEGKQSRSQREKGRTGEAGQENSAITGKEHRTSPCAASTSEAGSTPTTSQEIQKIAKVGETRPRLA